MTTMSYPKQWTLAGQVAKQRSSYFDRPVVGRRQTDGSPPVVSGAVDGVQTRPVSPGIQGEKKPKADVYLFGPPRILDPPSPGTPRTPHPLDHPTIRTRTVSELRDSLALPADVQRKLAYTAEPLPSSSTTSSAEQSPKTPYEPLLSTFPSDGQQLDSGALHAPLAVVFEERAEADLDPNASFFDKGYPRANFNEEYRFPAVKPVDDPRPHLPHRSNTFPVMSTDGLRTQTKATVSH